MTYLKKYFRIPLNTLPNFCISLFVFTKIKKKPNNLITSLNSQNHCPNYF